MKKQPSRHLLRSYGFGIDRKREMLSAQGERCEICGCALELSKAHVDHCHATSVIRGILCTRCNSLLGMARDSSETLQRAIAYLGRHSSKEEKVYARPYAGKTYGPGMDKAFESWLAANDPVATSRRCQDCGKALGPVRAREGRCIQHALGPPHTGSRRRVST